MFCDYRADRADEILLPWQLLSIPSALVVTNHIEAILLTCLLMMLHLEANTIYSSEFLMQCGYQQVD